MSVYLLLLFLLLKTTADKRLTYPIEIMTNELTESDRNVKYRNVWSFEITFDHKQNETLITLSAY